MKPFRARRSLGQSFLIHNPTADALVAALDVRPGDTVLEVGPGKGVLTRRLVGKAKRIVAVEIDRRLVELLESSPWNCAALELVHDDFLAFDMRPLGRVRLLGNLPYNISSQVLFRLLEFSDCWEVAVLTTQREFARRVLAEPGIKAHGAISVFLERVCVREKLFDIPPDRFRPKPEITSTAFRLRRRSHPLFPVADEPLFRWVVKAAFVQRRKMLVNNYAAGFGIGKDRVLDFLSGCGIDGKVRGETLGMDDFERLYRAVEASPVLLDSYRSRSSR